ncbi:serine/threonine transporter SstT [Gilliamella apicola]|uniref:serine/threonine transporter SstT n=1 Tax=Gilliamella apicola TaxID=1196095 RepID=UPI000A334573|nr:serine/threonine transporter SstT [Gilliamella apicola]OTP87806.1 serine/threonine transporter SstT [Gilliamella apicola]OTP92716.1 serine/threonine transporter SstT [Gilliamella apicola]OTP93021.1 serine/threonine transporter SstT [Gilliamella apicola]OTQ02752.1 serine/threonine transporter SstT [Gilliamella apicola]OTQ04347.1 serine/threonine transporter SstT [Gilliamella apicola]
MPHSTNRLVRIYFKVGLIPQIILGLILGIALAAISKDLALDMSFIGALFINALKSVAPILVLILVIASISNHQHGKRANMGELFILYFSGMMLAALLATVASFIFPSVISLGDAADQSKLTPPGSIVEVLKTLFNKMIDNPVNALVNANYIGLIVWGVGIGIALRHSSETTKIMMNDLSLAISFIVRIIIRFAPLGVFGLVASTLAETGFGELLKYAHLLVVLVSCMLIVALIVNPLLAYIIMRKNPYPLVLTSLKDSAIPAFFTRSSAANIPVNIEICKRLKMDEDTYSVAVPLGAAINMSGAAITITILTLATVNSLHIEVDIFSAVLLCIVTSVCACGASGIAGGSLLLIPVACSMFGIPNEISAKVIGIGIAIGVIQDSVETALNSSSDVVFIGAVSEKVQRNKTK